MDSDSIPTLIVSNSIEYDTLPLESAHRIAYQVTHTADGSTITLPCLILVGRSHHPRLACVAGVHGNEHEGITALLELWQELSPEILNGTLVMVPVANPPAFRAGARRNPEDAVDMNRIFPGDQTGTVTEQLAYHLFHGIMPGADLLLSMHGWTDDSLVAPYSEYPLSSPVTPASLAAAQAFGLPYIEGWEWPHGLLTAACSRAGIPAIEPEIGGLGCTVPERRALYKQGVRNLLMHLGILEGEPIKAETVQSVSREILTAPVGGVLLRHVELGEAVEEHQPVATITDLTGGKLADLCAPAAGFIAQQRLRASVSPGDLVAVIFQVQDSIEG